MECITPKLNLIGKPKLWKSIYVITKKYQPVQNISDENISNNLLYWSSFENSVSIAQIGGTKS